MLPNLATSYVLSGSRMTKALFALSGFIYTLPNFKLLSISPELIWNIFPVIQAVASESGFMAVSLVPLNWMESFVSLSLDALAESPRIILPLSESNIVFMTSNSQHFSC